MPVLARTPAYCPVGNLGTLPRWRIILRKKKQIVPTASAILEDGTIVEMAFQPEQRRTFFAIYNAGRWTLQDGIDLGSDARLVPFSPNNNLVKNEVVLLPSEPTIYGSEEKLVADIQQFIHRYVDFESIV